MTQEIDLESMPIENLQAIADVRGIDLVGLEEDREQVLAVIRAHEPTHTHHKHSGRGSPRQGGSPCTSSPVSGQPHSDTLHSPEDILGSVEDILQCPLCLDSFAEPISIACGHTFCRVCLATALERTKKRCPNCRAVCHVDARTAAENVSLTAIAKALSISGYTERLAESDKEKQKWKSTLPIFFDPNTMFPGCHVPRLHLYEARYLHMINRAVCGDRKFVHLTLFTPTTAAGVGLLAHLDDCEFWPNGQAVVSITFKERVNILSSWVEDGTQLLHYCHHQVLHDDDVTDEERADIDRIIESTSSTAEAFFELAGEGSRSHLRREIGDEPPHTQTEQWSLWVAALASRLGRMGPRAQPMLETKSTKDRLEKASAVLVQIVQSMQHQRMVQQAQQEAMQQHSAYTSMNMQTELSEHAVGGGPPLPPSPPPSLQNHHTGAQPARHYHAIPPGPYGQHHRHGHHHSHSSGRTPQHRAYSQQYWQQHHSQMNQQASQHSSTHQSTSSTVSDQPSDASGTNPAREYALNRHRNLRNRYWRERTTARVEPEVLSDDSDMNPEVDRSYLHDTSEDTEVTSLTASGSDLMRSNVDQVMDAKDDPDQHNTDQTEDSLGNDDGHVIVDDTTADQSDVSVDNNKRPSCTEVVRASPTTSNPRSPVIPTQHRFGTESETA